MPKIHSRKKSPPSNDVPLFSELVEAYILHRIRPESRSTKRAEYDVRLYGKTHLADLMDKRIDQLKVEDFLKIKQRAGEKRVAATRAIQLCGFCIGPEKGWTAS